jgi:hypothetical protein
MWRDQTASASRSPVKVLAALAAIHQQRAADYPPRIGEIAPVGASWPVVRRPEDRRKPPRQSEGEPSEHRGERPQDGHIIDEYAA